MPVAADSRYKHPWEFPDCPSCQGHAFVESAGTRDGAWVCHICNEVFDT